MKQITYLLAFLLCFLFTACDDDKENVIDFEVPELTADNSITFTFTPTGPRYLSFNIGGSMIAVDWGDGSDNGYRVPNNGECIHRYKTGGSYQVKVWSEHLTFFNLTGLTEEISDLQIGSCPVLTELIINSITDVEEFKIDRCPRLKNLNIGNWDKLSSLDLSKCTTLEDLSCYTHPLLTSLDLSENKKLTDLYLHYVPISEIDLSNNTALIRVDINNSDITTLSLVNNKELGSVCCAYNKLKEIKVPNENKIYELVCMNNEFEFLNLIPFSKLQRLVCNANKLTILDLYPCPGLIDVRCTNNKLTQIDIPEKSILKMLLCSSNELSAQELDRIFTALPEATFKYPGSRLSPPPVYNVIQYNFNPGEKDCKADIITQKGWKVTQETKQQ